MIQKMKRGAAVLSAAAALAAASILTTPTANAVDSSYGAVTTNCSWGSCSLYLSRSATKEVNSRIDALLAGGTATSAAVCTALGTFATPVAGAICGGAAAYGAVNGIAARDSIKEAAEAHGPGGACFKVTKAHVSGQPYYSTNNGRFCKN